MLKKENHWETLSSKKLFGHPRLSVHEDKVRLPNGIETDYIHFGSDAGAAVIIAIGKDGKVLVQKEYSYPPREYLFQFPGGAIEIDEDPEKGASRELAEESKLGGSLEQIGWFYLDNRRKASKMHVFVATGIYAAEGINDPEEEFEDFWLTIGEVNENIRANKIRTYSALAAWAFFVNSKFYKK